MDSPDDFAARLRALIARHDVSLDVVAERIGRTKQALSKWQNKRSQPTVKDIAALCMFFGCSADYLVGLSPFHGGIAPNQWILNEKALAEARSTGRKKRRVLIQTPEQARLISNKEAIDIIKELDLRIE